MAAAGGAQVPAPKAWRSAARRKAGHCLRPCAGALSPEGRCVDSVCGTMPSSGRDLVTVALCCLAAIVEGYDIQSMGVAAPGLAPALHLTRDQLGPAFSASTVGLFIGAIAIGRLADRIGRKWALVGSLATFGLFSLATPYANGLASLLAIRFAAGLGLGGAMPNLIALASEAVSAARQASLVAIAAASMPLGGSIASGVAASLP